MEHLELYLHIPFCVKKCAYCDFLSFPAGRSERSRYLSLLTEEIESGLPAALSEGRTGEVCVDSAFVGGGTPSILSAAQIESLMSAIFRTFPVSEDAEITLECNPGTTGTDREGRKKLKAWKKCGINRLSFGLQSSDNAQLATLGRIHTWEDFLRSYEDAREEGFENINIDLMSALPGQSVASWEKTLRAVLGLSPEHISAYSLIIEEGTPFYGLYHEEDLRRRNGEETSVLPSEEEERAMYDLTGVLMEEAGLHRYEISNYARAGRECRHNMGYWRGKEYLGFGLGAASYLRRAEKEGLAAMRLKNPESLSDYERAVHAPLRQGKKKGQGPLDTPKGAQAELLSKENEMEEFLFLGLRMMSGISEKEFYLRFGKTVEEIYGPVPDRLIRQGLLMREEGRLRLTPRGIDLSNPVMAEFLLT